MEPKRPVQIVATMRTHHNQVDLQLAGVCHNALGNIRAGSTCTCCCTCIECGTVLYVSFQISLGIISRNRVGLTRALAADWLPPPQKRDRACGCCADESPPAAPLPPGVSVSGTRISNISTSGKDHIGKRDSAPRSPLPQRSNVVLRWPARPRYRLCGKHQQRNHRKGGPKQAKPGSTPARVGSAPDRSAKALIVTSRRNQIGM